MIDIYKEIDWSEEIKTNPQMEEYIRRAAMDIQSNLKENELERPILDINLNLQIIGTSIISSHRYPLGP